MSLARALFTLAQLYALAGCTPVHILIAQRRSEYACRRRWGSIHPLPDLPADAVPLPETSHKSLMVRMQCDLPAEVESFARSEWPPPWSHTRPTPRINWDIDPARAGPDRRDRVALMDALYTPERWMVYCDGSFVWRPEDPDTSKGGAGVVLIHQEHVLEYARLGLGSHTHSRDAELWALLRALQLLNKNPPSDYVKEVIIVSDAALALKQLRHTKPEPGHYIVLKWHEAAQALLEANPHITLRVMWGPSKDSQSIVVVDQLAKRSRTTGLSPLVSLRTHRINVRNNSLQE